MEGVINLIVKLSLGGGKWRAGRGEVKALLGAAVEAIGAAAGQRGSDAMCHLS